MFQFLRHGRRNITTKSCCRDSVRASAARQRVLRHETLEDRSMMALLGVEPLSMPTIAYNSGGTVSYDAATDEFSVHATPLSSTTGSGTGFFFTGTLDIKAIVDASGSLVGGVAGDDLVLVGDLDIDGDFNVDFSGTLLTAEITAFGFQDSGGTTDKFDYRFTITGGSLAGLFTGKDLGVFTNSENSTFAGSFETNFGGNAKGDLGAIDKLQEFASLSGVKYTDITGNGISGDDTPLAGVTINLYQDTGTIGVIDGELVLASTVTDVDGKYSFAGLAPGNYIVQEVVPGGYIPQTPVFYALSLAAGDNITTGYDFANSKLGSISGTKLTEVTECECDKYGNPIEKVVTKPLANVTINLYKDTGAAGVIDGEPILATTTTDANGNYSFVNLAPGNYLVQEVLQSGYVAITPAVVVASVTSGANLDRDFKNKLVKASVGNYFFIDSNSNGIQDVGDFGVNGVTVKLLDKNGKTIATTQTANDGSGNAGYYLFYDLDAGNYAVEFVVPTGVVFTIKDVSSNSKNSIDSDANSNGRTDYFSLAANQHRRDIDAGIKPDVCIENVVYKVKDYFDKCQQSAAGTIKGVTLEYNDTSEELFVQVTVASYNGKIANGFTIVLDDGGSIGSAKAGTYAVIYFDASGAAPVLNVLAYNGTSDGSSFKDSNGVLKTVDPDRIATSLNNASGWVKELTATGNSSKKVFTFRIDVGAINDHAALQKVNWQGAEIGKYASFKLDTFAGLSTKYDANGFLSKWSYTCRGGMDACKITTQKCIVKENVAIDSLFAEWGWTKSAFTGNSNGDPLQDIFWAGSEDALDCDCCDKPSNPCDDKWKDWDCNPKPRC